MDETVTIFEVHIGRDLCRCIDHVKPGGILWLKSINPNICGKCGKVVVMEMLSVAV